MLLLLLLYYYYYFYYIIIIIILENRFTMRSEGSMCTEANGTLYCMREENNSYDKHAIAVAKHKQYDMTEGHILYSERMMKLKL